MVGPMRTRRAFTLIELIAVIVVLAILAGVAIPRFLDQSDAARISAAKGARSALASAVLNYRMHSEMETGEARWPTDLLEIMESGGEHLWNPYHDASAGEVVHYYDWAGDIDRIVPAEKTVEWAVANGRGTVWYNRASGQVFFRVPEQSSASATVDLFNEVNGTNVTALNQTGW